MSYQPPEGKIPTALAIPLGLFFVVVAGFSIWGVVVVVRTPEPVSHGFNPSTKVPTPGRAPVVKDPRECPDLWPGQEDGAPPITCKCSDPDYTRRIWGTAQYTSDSPVCTAALHAKVVGLLGGWVQVASSPGCPAYRGSHPDHVWSDDYHSWSASFYFPANGEPTCSQILPKTSPRQLGPNGEVPPSPCPAGLPLDAAVGTTLRCACAAPIAMSPIWGSNPYSFDSSPCVAAVHAGAIATTGGDITIAVEPGCETVVGSAAHGLISHDAPPGERQFRIVTTGEQPTAPCTTAPVAKPGAK